jgi:ligand-binding sensor domain-containing protein
LDSAVEIRLSGLCGRTLRVGAGDVVAHIESDSQAFVRWVTQRGNWEQLGVHAEGDATALETVRRLCVI